MNSINYQYHKFSGYILAPIRLIGFTVCTAVTIGMTAFCHKIQSDTLFHKFINFMNPLYLSIFGLKLHIEGEYNNKTPCIISSNHINLYDHFKLLEHHFYYDNKSAIGLCSIQKIAKISQYYKK